MSVLQNKVSKFDRIRSVDVAGQITVEEALQSFRTPSPDVMNVITELRSGESDDKSQLPMYAMHGIFKHYRQKSDFIESSGILIIDIDDVNDDVEEIKKDIIDSYNYVLAAMVSPSGTGVKLLVRVDEEFITEENYRDVGKVISTEFKGYGHIDALSITDCLIATYDPNILVNEQAVVKRVILKEIKRDIVDLEPLDTSKDLWTDAEEFYLAVLHENIAGKSDNNYHFIQMSLFDLARFGFTHPSHDLSFVIDCAEACHKRSSDNKGRFLEAAALAAQSQQSVWPYIVRRKRDEDDEFEDDLDYSEYITPNSVKGAPKEQINNSEQSEGGLDALIDYSGLFGRVKSLIQEGDKVGREISLSNFASVFRLKGTGVFTITGIPSHGKTEFSDQLVLDLARLYGEETLIAGFEQSPEEHIIKLARKAVGLNITDPSYWKDYSNQSHIEKVTNWITGKLFHLDTNKIGGDINKILKTAAEWIKHRRDNGGDPKYLLIDPFNMLSIKGKLNGHEKIEEILRRLTLFSHQMGVMVILIAHPYKMKKDEKTGMYEIPDFYSVKGTSAFFEMSYHGICVYRRGGVGSTEVLVRILKVKQNNLGRAGADVFFDYHRPSGRYIPLDDDGNELQGDHHQKDWLNKQIYG